jgi:hypothetical protein
VIRRLTDDTGMSLTELLVVCTLMGIVLGSIFMAFGATQAIADTAAARTAASDESQQFFDRISRELRQAQENGEGTGVCAIAEPRRVVFYVDLDQNGRPERVTYKMSGTSLMRSEASPTNAFPPYTYGPESAARTVIKKVRPDWMGEVFQYYTSANPPVKLNNTQLPSIASLRINVVNQVRSGSRTVNLDASTWIKIRSVYNAVD